MLAVPRHGDLLLVVHARFVVFGDATAGGLQSQSSKSAAFQLLASLLAVVPNASGMPWRCSVKVVSSWTCEWPRPSRRSDDGLYVDLEVSGGRLDFACIREIAGKKGIAREWVRALDCAFGTEARDAPLATFASALIVSKAVVSLCAQVLWYAAQLVEKAIGGRSQQQRRASSEAGAISAFQWQGAESARGPQQDLFITKYIMSCREHMQRHRVFFVATDKGQVCRLPLQNSVLGVAGNLVVICPPNVRRAAPLTPDCEPREPGI